MINTNLSELLGFECHLLNDDRTVAIIDTPFLFYDGDSIPVYLEQLDGKLRFFDGGEIIARFEGFGYHLGHPNATSFIEVMTAPHGVIRNEDEFEIWAEPEQVPSAFVRYVSAMLAIIRWEQDAQALADQRRQREKTAESVEVSWPVHA